MTINIIADDTSDKDILNAFCRSTGWKQASGKTKKQWFSQEVTRWITAQARAGFVSEKTSTNQSALATAIKTALVDARNTIPIPTVNVG